MTSTTKMREVPAQMLAVGPAAEAAKRLVKQLGAPRAHSVWVRSELGPELYYPDGSPIPRTMTPIICVARHPKHGQALEIPVMFEGFAVREMPWE